MPTSLTGAKKLAATAAWLAEPPSNRGLSRQGVLIESKAVEPTTRTLIIWKVAQHPPRTQSLRYLFSRGLKVTSGNVMPASCRRIVLSRIASLCRQDAGSTLNKKTDRAIKVLLLWQPCRTGKTFS